MIKASLKKYKDQLGDSVFSMLGLVLMNAVCQLLVFPLLNRVVGGESFGNIQYLIAYINIVTVSVGAAANLARMTSPADERMENAGDYNLFLLLVCLLGLPITLLIRRFGGVEMDLPTTVCYYLLFCTMAFRYYADVAYKLTLRFRGYFCYYAVIGGGYVLGALLFLKTGIWPLTLLVGELAGVLFAYITSPELHRRALRISPNAGRVLRIILLLVLSEGVSNLILNADRLMLKLMVGASAVTVYYLATLVGKTMSLLTVPIKGVVIGYLVRYDGDLTRRAMHFLLLAGLGGTVLGTLGCMLGGYIVLWLLYPTELASVTPFLFAGSLAQALFFLTDLFMVVLIRFAEKRYQIYVNGVFGICFFGIGIPATLLFGLWGFAGAMIAATAIRFAVSMLLGYYHTRSKPAAV